MERYKNRSGDSGVAFFELSPGRIVVEFDGGAQYEYTADSAGAAHIAQMHRLAKAGRGLSAYISAEVRERYSRKLR